MSKGTFTFKQLLLSVAIIVASAVILVPTVSAQGSKGGAKSWYLTQLHQMGMMFGQYSFDWDDRLPLSYYRRESGSWATGTLYPSPVDVLMDPSWETPAVIASTRAVWRNSRIPYGPYPGTFMPGAPDHLVSGDMFDGTPNLTHGTMNGLLHTYRLAQIPEPETVPLVWSGVGRANLRGRALSNPVLNCFQPVDCYFNPVGPPTTVEPSASWDGTAFALDYTSWIFGQTGPELRVDGSVRLVPMGLKVAPNQHEWPNITGDPWAQVDSNGEPNGMWYCGPGHSAATPSWPVNNQGAYPCYFRPDRTE